MATDPITSWQIVGEKVEAVTSFIFLGSQITVDSDYSHKIKRCLLLGRKIKTKLNSLLKSRDFTDKGPSSQSYDFSSSHVWMWKLDHKEDWVPENWCFSIVVLEKTLESPLGSKERRSNQSVLKEISPEYSLEGLMLKLKLQYFGHLMWRMDFLEKTVMLGKIEGRKGSGWQRMKWLDSITDSIWVTLLWTFIYKLMCEHMFLFSGINPGVEFWGHDRNCRTFWGIAKLFSKAVVSFCILAANVWAFWFHYPFPNTEYHIFDYSHTSGCAVVSLGFWFILS